MGVGWSRLAMVLIILLSVACRTSDAATERAAVGATPLATLGPLPAVAPPLPFPDNPDPEQCGIPTPWGKDDTAWLTGIWQGELVQPVVYLYDSHLRREVVGQIPHGGRVEIQLFQSNPVLHFYRVRSLDLTPVQEGWVPAPFLSHEAVK